jgi:hypothetical protein
MRLPAYHPLVPLGVGSPPVKGGERVGSRPLCESAHRVRVSEVHLMSCTLSTPWVGFELTGVDKVQVKPCTIESGRIGVKVSNRCMGSHPLFSFSALIDVV